MALFTRITVWNAGQILTASALNAEFDNLLAGFTPAQIEGASATTSAMQSMVDPGENGTESLAGSLLGEIQRLRYAIADIKSGAADNWYPTPPKNLTQLATLLVTSVTTDGTDPGAGGFSYSARLVAYTKSDSGTIPSGTPTYRNFTVDPTEWQVTLTTRGRPVEIFIDSSNTAAAIPTGGGATAVASSSYANFIPTATATFSQQITTALLLLVGGVDTLWGAQLKGNNVSPTLSFGMNATDNYNWIQELQNQKLILPSLAAGSHTFRLKMGVTYLTSQTSGINQTMGVSFNSTGLRICAREL